MGIPMFNIASSVSIIIAQRLARRLCTHCKQARNDCTPQSLIHLGFAPEDAYNIKVYKAVGCSQCAGGYRGRVGLYEVLSMTKQLGQKIMNGANSIEILNQALHDGMLTIVQSGLEKIKQGITTIEELNRVTVD
jgi:type IV pilus assembly protein PilB